MDKGNALWRESWAEAFFSSDGSNISAEQKLKMLLSYNIHKDLDKKVATLIATFGSANGVFEADKYELQAAGLSEKSASMILLVRAFYGRCLVDKIRKLESISNLDEVANFFRVRIGNLKSETLLVLFYDMQCNLLKIESFSGTIDHAVIYPRELINTARNVQAKLMILAHNHPSGQCQPSADDILLTNQIITGAEMFDIYVADHIVVSTHDQFSMRKHNMID